MATESFLYKSEYVINDKIKVLIPTVGEVMNDEDSYYGIVTMFTACPIDFMVMLADNGIDFDSINDWELFLILFGSIQKMDTRIVFGDLDFTKFKLAINKQNGDRVLVDQEHDIVIDRAIHDRIADVLRFVNNIEKNTKKPANREAREFMIERARKKANRKRKNKKSQMEQLIVAMVNSKEYKYNFEETKNLTIYQFNESVRQVVKRVDYDNRMYGVYSGCLDVKTLSKDDLNWLTHK